MVRNIREWYENRDLAKMEHATFSNGRQEHREAGACKTEAWETWVCDCGDCEAVACDASECMDEACVRSIRRLGMQGREHARKLCSMQSRIMYGKQYLRGA